MHFLTKYDNTFWGILALSLCLAAGISMQLELRGERSSKGIGGYTHYNNYEIFVQSFWHLDKGQDLYEPYEDEYYDLYKYSPTFAIGMAPFAVMPIVFGLGLWQFLNTFFLLYGLAKVREWNTRWLLVTITVVVLELVTSLLNAQSNGIIAGLFIWSAIALQKKKYAWSALLLAIAIFIKPFATVGFALFLLSKQRLRLGVYSLLFLLLGLALPLLVTSPTVLVEQYASWWNLLQNDFSSSYGFSIYGWLYTWTDVRLSKNVIMLFGVALFVLPLVKHYAHWPEKGFRLLVLASVLLWVVVFNHKAESPTFVIAVAGAMLWFFSSKMSAWRIALLFLLLVFTCLGSTDLFPRSFRNDWIGPYALKGIPCVVIWFVLQWEMLFYRPKDELSGSTYA